MKTVESFIIEARKVLMPLYDASEAEQVIFLLLEDVAGVSRSKFHESKARLLQDSDLEKFDKYLEQLGQNKPVQYVLGSAWFAGMKLEVNEHVLIPRPETEELCEWLLAHVAPSNAQLSILDIGTGSGCIAIALKKKLPLAALHALDISEEALAIAKQNAAQQGAEIHFYRSDILSKDFQNSISQKFDVIVSNPPYVRKSEKDSVHFRVKNFEPQSALFVEDEDALIFYRHIVAFAKTHLKPGGQLFFEINESLGTEVKKLLEQNGFRDIELRKDLSGKQRMLRSSTPSNPK